MKKRLLSVFLALALCLGLAVPAFAADSEFIIKNGVITEYTGPGGDVVVPDGVTAIGVCAFNNAEGGLKVTSVTLPSSVTTIMEGAFQSCISLNSIILPPTLTKIDSLAFVDCRSLASINIPNSVTVIEPGTFNYCTNLTSVTLPSSVNRIGLGTFTMCTSLNSITLPPNLTIIESNLFWGCENLTSVAIPSSVTKIEFNAFRDSGLKDVYYGGTESQWRNIEIDELGNDAIFSATIHYNSSALPAPTPPFTDVPDWCSAAVDWAISRKITDGVGNNRFAPSNQCTNAMILTFLWRAAGEPGSSAALPVDITGKGLAYAETALRWAAEKGMVDQTLDPTANCTRASAVSYIWQAFGKGGASASSFSDVSASASYARAVNWAVANGIVEGYSDGAFHPDTICNRGVIVTMLHRAYVPGARLK